MATQGPTQLPAYFNVDADFRVWGQGISAMLLALGLVQTADTGQINWATVLKPAAASTAQGYEIWRFADTLQATAPVFIKVEYGSSFSTATVPGLWITVGSASNGSGTLLGQASARQQAGGQNNRSAGATLATYASGSTGELQLITNLDTLNLGYALFFAVLRPRDASGNPTGEGVIIFGGSSQYNQLGNFCQFVPTTGIVPALLASWPTFSPAFFGRSAAGAQADVCPLLLPLFGNWRYGKFLLTGATELPPGAVFTVTIMGATHTFLGLGLNYYSTTAITPVGAGSAPGIAMAWE